MNLTKEQKLVRKAVREFTEKELAPLAAEIDKTGEFPKELFAELGRYSLLSVPTPKEYGGAGGDYMSYAITVEELSKQCASTALYVSGTSSLFTWPILKFGTEEQKRKYAVPLAKGEKIGCFALTEAGAGSDAAAQQTTAVLEGEHYTLNGTKCFITLGAVADIAIVFAMTDKAKGLKGISAFIVETNSPGFSVGKNEDKMGIKGTVTSELIFENVKVPRENLLGREGKGFKIAMATLDGGRLGIAAQALGIAQGAMDETVKYLKERQQFGKPLAKFQGIQWMIADMETKINAARLLVYNAALQKDLKLPAGKESAMAKLYAAEVAMDVTTKAVQLHGGYGYTKDYPVERMMRDAKITEIYEGTSQVQKMVIAANVLG
ncbi:MAG: acyl-CoA dehydrogenase [Rickettsiales bacterium]|jgi:butyryl-CoA dehydrogenase|nr:acyl-CoA dehydrogenase [Rickettsiales bacterium]